ncbi:flagellum-specific ATP synthase [Diaminobutyricimonas aerilata]|uniref:Flagellum-specific ATP synthase n=1 Tax=Diaminobutyricimonas aerilata TaxID=1162967 RepID=A0A2M9CN05_9MICO|nr:FliI/YscN family ATPase [Diaminobutyricimonas aerilata]PJJ73287.1 flagellum-specific ATP synthase [Diaminobutyricimonas aerilata]
MSAAVLHRPTALDRVTDAARPLRSGTVAAVAGLGIEIRGLTAGLGDLVTLGDGLRAEVVAVARDSITAMPLDRTDGLVAGTPATTARRRMLVPTGPALLGRVLDATGAPLDDRGPLGQVDRVPVDADAPPALDRARIRTALPLGVRVLDTLTTVGVGQRIGLFAGSGVGKSSLLSMIARGTAAEVSVIALIGERGREVREFLEDDLGPDGLARSVVVVATADQPALMRVRAAFTATRIAEAFRDAGSHVTLMMDSLTRVAMAQREIGLSVGEPPATRGYPPSVFGLLARLLERAGTGPRGSVTGIYTVLVDGDDHNEPIADTARSILDGHVVLDRRLAAAGHFPSIDVLGSVSRVASRVSSPEQVELGRRLRRVLAARRTAQDLLDVGAYARGANPLVDAAVDHEAAIDAFLQQRVDETANAEDSWARLADLVATMGATS